MQGEVRLDVDRFTAMIMLIEEQRREIERYKTMEVAVHNAFIEAEAYSVTHDLVDIKVNAKPIAEALGMDWHERYMRFLDNRRAYRNGEVV